MTYNDYYLLDLFAGIGGFHLAAKMAGMEFKQTFFSEINEHAIKIYKKNFPSSIALGDVTRINGRDLPTGNWILTGGFPCQPFSIAGNQQGSSDSRYLWGEIVRLVSELKPVWVICENVPQIANVAFSISEFEVVSRQRHQDTEKDVFKGVYSRQEELQLYRCCQDLKKQGYEVAVFEIPALAKNAPHRRMRTWIIANRNRSGLERRSQQSFPINRQNERLYSESEINRGFTNSDTDQTPTINSIPAGRSVNGSVSINGHSQRKFQPKRGVRKVGRWIRNGFTGNPDSNCKSSGNGCAESSGRKESGSNDFIASNANRTRLERRGHKRGITKIFSQNRVQLCFGNSSNLNRTGSFKERQEFSRWKNDDRRDSHKWFEVATEFCFMDDGLSSGLDLARLRADISRLYPNATDKDIRKAIGKLISKYRRERIESLGNSIVPVVAMEFFRVIKEIEK